MKLKRSCQKIISVLLSLTFTTALIPQSVLADGSDSQQSLTGTSVSETENSVDSVYALADLLYQNNSNLATRTGGFIWDTEGKKRSWTYYNGIMMDAFLMLDRESYLNYVNSYYEANINSAGKVDSTGASDNYYRENELDSIPPARALFDLIREEELNQYTGKYKMTIDYIYGLLQNHEVVEGTDGNFKHKMNNTNWNTYPIALDGLYMAQPFFMEVANALDDGTLSFEDFQTYSGKEPDPDQIYHDVANRMLWIGDNLYSSENHLYCHGWGADGLNGQHWLRAVGWYAAALADVISMLPDEGYDEEKSALIEVEKQLFDGMLDYRDEATGMWYNVIDHGPELVGTGCDNELETSGSALIAYAMMKSYVEGYLDDTYGEAGLKAFNGIVKNYLDSEGLHNVYISAGVETAPEGYLSKSYKLNEAKGVGPLMMAASYANAAAAKFHTVPSDKTFSVTFDLNGGVHDGSTDLITGTTNADGRIENYPSAFRSGHSFVGWFTAATGGDRVGENHVFTDDTQLYAHWITYPVLQSVSINAPSELVKGQDYDIYITFRFDRELTDADKEYVDNKHQVSFSPGIQSESSNRYEGTDFITKKTLLVPSDTALTSITVKALFSDIARDEKTISVVDPTYTDDTAPKEDKDNTDNTDEMDKKDKSSSSKVTVPYDYGIKDPVRVTVGEEGKELEVIYTKSVPFDGKKHVNADNPKNSGKITKDVQVVVINKATDEVIDNTKYKLTFKKNRKAGTACFKVTLKGPAWKDKSWKMTKKLVKKTKFEFAIVGSKV